MPSDEFTELSARCEALSRLVLHLAAQLEDSGIMDGHRLQEEMTAWQPQGSPVLERAAMLSRELMASYSVARSHRRTAALRSGNLGGRTQND